MFAQVYDKVMSDVPYSSWCKYVMELWERHGHYARSVLDIACGTGSMTLLLASQGYDVTGVDLSKYMISVARAKASAAGLYVRFFERDMRNLGFEEEFDSAICLFDSLNYLLKPQDVIAHFKSTFKALRPGGLYVFDVNTKRRLETIQESTCVYDEDDYYLVWRDWFDESDRCWHVHLTGFLLQDGKWVRFDEEHREHAFELELLREWLHSTGFAVRGVYHSQTFSPANEYTSRAYFIAEKPSEKGVPKSVRKAFEIS